MMSVTINKTKTGGATKFSPTNYAQVAKGFFFDKDLFCPPLSKKNITITTTFGKRGRQTDWIEATKVKIKNTRTIKENPDLALALPTEELVTIILMVIPEVRDDKINLHLTKKIISFQDEELEKLRKKMKIQLEQKTEYDKCP